MNESAVDELSRSEQDYLTAIYRLTRNGQATSTLALAEALGVKPASVTNMLQKLDDSQPRLVYYRKGYGATLSPEGEAAALRMIRRHRLIEQFLVQVLDYPWEAVHAEAEVLEHAVSPLFEERLARLLGNPSFDPHGDPIPSQALQVDEAGRQAQLSALSTGQSGIVRRVSDQRPELLAYLGQVGIHPGVEVTVISKNPVDGAVRLQVGGREEETALGSRLQENVWVEAI